MQTREENIQHIATTIQYSSTNNMHPRFNMNPVTPPASFENQTFGWVLKIISSIFLCFIGLGGTAGCNSILFLYVENLFN